MKKHFLFAPVFLLGLFLTMSISSCDKGDKTKFGIFEVQADGVTVQMDGEIRSGSLDDFNELIEAYPNVNHIDIVNCGGSLNDEINLQLSLKVHQEGISIHLMDNGMIASGGVDFFLAGTQRTKGTNTQIGVHSWSDGQNEATDFEVGHTNHQPYIDYYQSVGFSQADAEAFYYFTINAAPAADVHWMTESEIDQYKILTP